MQKIKTQKKMQNANIQQFFSKPMNAGLAAIITDAVCGRREQMTTQRACTVFFQTLQPRRHRNQSL